jgi:hypothetical protein
MVRTAFLIFLMSLHLLSAVSFKLPTLPDIPTLPPLPDLPTLPPLPDLPTLPPLTTLPTFPDLPTLPPNVSDTISSIFNLTDQSGCSIAFEQCGGRHWSGATCCEDEGVGWKCEVKNEYYSQCVPRCPRESPCWNVFSNSCSTGDFSLHNGNGEIPRCSMTARCVREEWCYDAVSLECACMGVRPCRRRSLLHGVECLPRGENGVCEESTVECRAAQWQQCGGLFWHGIQECQDGLTCIELNSFYSQCLRNTERE